VLIAVLLAAGLVLEVHPAALALGALAAVEPRIVLLGAAAWGVVHAMRRRRSRVTPEDEATYFRALSAELKAGASLRGALGEAVDRVPSLSLDRAVRFAAAGAPMAEIADVVEVQFPENGGLAGAAFRLSDWSGARVADAFAGLADRAAASAELARERRAATAQARLSASVIGIAPVAFAALLLATGRGSSLLDQGLTGLAILGLGLALEILGLIIVALIIRRAER
jgi:Flp pilus assembly protein TadB